MNKMTGIIILIFVFVSLLGCDSKTGTNKKDTDNITKNVEPMEIATATPMVNNEVVIYLVRHGQTLFNVTGQVQGACDSPLTKLGVKQAKALGKNLSDIEFIKAYSGTLGRQKTTLRYILQNMNNAPDIKETEGLNERNFGSFEGKTDLEMWTMLFNKAGYKMDKEWSHYNDVYEKLGGDKGIADMIAANDPDGMAENYDQILQRARTCMEQIVGEGMKTGGNVFLVSSGMQIQVILKMLIPDQYNGESIENCSVTILRYKNGNYSVDKIGDTSYVQDVK